MKKHKKKRSAVHTRKYHSHATTNFLKFIFSFVGLAMLLMIGNILYVSLQEYFFVLGATTVR